jgi:hypothetical protein
MVFFINLGTPDFSVIYTKERGGGAAVAGKLFRSRNEWLMKSGN